jgi:hypothetical protein
MNGLRVYISPTATNANCLQGVFYSRRADGPYYRWRYEEAVGQWRGSRISPADLTHKALNLASWKNVPSALQSKLHEHYLE